MKGKQKRLGESGRRPSQATLRCAESYTFSRAGEPHRGHVVEANAVVRLPRLNLAELDLHLVPPSFALGKMDLGCPSLALLGRKGKVVPFSLLTALLPAALQRAVTRARDMQKFHASQFCWQIRLAVRSTVWLASMVCELCSSLVTSTLRCALAWQRCMRCHIQSQYDGWKRARVRSVGAPLSEPSAARQDPWRDDTATSPLDSHARQQGR